MQKHKKRLGQHFLHDKNIIKKIIKNLKADIKDTFIEIGPGEGALTTPLLEEVKNIILNSHINKIKRRVNAILKSNNRSQRQKLISNL